MSRPPELDAILQARYDLEMCEPAQKTERRAHLESLVQVLLSQPQASGLSHRDLIQILAERYRDFKRARKQEERARLSRLR